MHLVFYKGLLSLSSHMTLIPSLCITPSPKSLGAQTAVTLTRNSKCKLVRECYLLIVFGLTHWSNIYNTYSMCTYQRGLIESVQKV